MSMKLKDVISEYASKEVITEEPEWGLGSDGMAAPEEPAPAVPVQISIDREALKSDLEKVKKNNGRYFLVCVLMIVLLFLVSIAVVLTNLGSQNVVTVAMSAFGISTAGLIWLMIKLWRDKSNTEFLLVIAIYLDAASLSKVIDVLAKRLSE